MEKYIINKELGSGSFGKVYTVESRVSGIQYVVKQIDFTKLDKRQRSLAEKEFQVLAKLKHPYIVGYKEAYTDDQHLHIVMELCENGDLHNRIQEARTVNQRFTDAQVMEYFVQIALALEYIHNQRILHRDLKTKNVFLTKGNVIKLGDFGVSKVLEDSLELARTCIGSPFYISPEICENQPYDKKSDVWALGCVLYELVTLRYAFTAKNMKLLLQKITTGDYQSLTQTTHRNIRHLVGRLLKTNPRLRPTVTEILAMPFIGEYRNLLSCRTRRNISNVRRTKSGEDLAIDIKRKTHRSMLPISKSSLNLNTPRDITDPEAKYRAPKIKKTLNKLNNSVEKKINLPRLKKTDSLYYSMIEESSRKGPQKCLKMVKNVFYDDLKEIDSSKDFVDSRSNGSLDMKNTSVKDYTTQLLETMVIKKTTENPKEIASDLTDKNDESTEIVEENIEVRRDVADGFRRRWATSTRDRDELICLLNEADLSSIFDTNTGITENKPNFKKDQSIDELLSLTTTDLAHLEVLQPEEVLYDKPTVEESLYERLETLWTEPKPEVRQHGSLEGQQTDKKIEERSCEPLDMNRKAEVRQYDGVNVKQQQIDKTIHQSWLDEMSQNRCNKEQRLNSMVGNSQYGGSKKQEIDIEVENIWYERLEGQEEENVRELLYKRIENECMDKQAEVCQYKCSEKQRMVKELETNQYKRLEEQPLKRNVKGRQHERMKGHQMQENITESPHERIENECMFKQAEVSHYKCSEKQRMDKELETYQYKRLEEHPLRRNVDSSQYERMKGHQIQENITKSPHERKENQSMDKQAEVSQYKCSEKQRMDIEPEINQNKKLEEQPLKRKIDGRQNKRSEGQQMQENITESQYGRTENPCMGEKAEVSQYQCLEKQQIDKEHETNQYKSLEEQPLKRNVDGRQHERMENPSKGEYRGLGEQQVDKRYKELEEHQIEANDEVSQNEESNYPRICYKQYRSNNDDNSRATTTNNLYERLEERRMELEKLIGLEMFVKIYKSIERRMEIEECVEDGSKTYLISDGKDCFDFKEVPKKHKDLVWELVRDDNIYKLQS